MWTWGMWKTLHYCSPSEGEFMQDRRDTVHVCVCIVSIVIYSLLNSCGFQKMFRYTKDRILGISHTFVNMWVVAKSLQQVRVFFMLPTFLVHALFFFLLSSRVWSQESRPNSHRRETVSLSGAQLPQVFQNLWRLTKTHKNTYRCLSGL